MRHKTRSAFKPASFPVLLGSLLVSGLLAGNATADASNPFGTLIGNWGGSGLMTLEGGVKERLVCEAQYSGGFAQLRLAINCKGGERDIRMSARLSSNAGRLLGVWEEKYFNALGAISGIATENKISFTVSGNVQGSMAVVYSSSKQQVSITAQGVPLQSIKISLTRR